MKRIHLSCGWNPLFLSFQRPNPHTEHCNVREQFSCPFKQSSKVYNKNLTLNLGLQLVCKTTAIEISGHDFPPHSRVEASCMKTNETGICTTGEDIKPSVLPLPVTGSVLGGGSGPPTPRPQRSCCLENSGRLVRRRPARKSRRSVLEGPAHTQPKPINTN